MRLTIRTKNYHVSERLQLIAERKIARIEKYFGGETECTMVCTKVGNVEKMEITIAANGQAFRAQAENRNMYANIDIILAKIERQVIKNKEKLQTVLRAEAFEDKKFAYISARQGQNLRVSEVKKNKSFDIKKLSDAEAALGLDTIDHNFFVYANKQSGHVNIMYRRDDGNVGVIEINNALIKS